MKKVIYSILFVMVSLFPVKVLAVGNISVSPGTLTIEQGSSKSFTISAYNAIGDVTIQSSNSAVASVSSSSWGTGMVEEKNTKTGSITVTGKSIGTATITLTIDGATFDKEDLSGQTRTITVNVVKPAPKPVAPTTPSTPSTNKNNNTTNNNSNNNNNVNNTEKKEEVKNDATLNSLVISGVNLEFDKNKTEYSVKVSNDITKLDIKATATSSKAKVEIPKDLNLKVGNNTIKIKVIAEDKTEKIYTINVERLNRELSKNNNLKDIKIKGYKLNFKKDVFVYDIGKIDKNKLDIEVVLEDKTATYEIKGNNSIGKNDVIVIKVTAEDKTTREYIIYANNIKEIKEVKESKLTPAIIISITTILLILIPMIVGFIKDRKKVELN